MHFPWVTMITIVTLISKTSESHRSTENGLENKAKKQKNISIKFRNDAR